MNKNELIKFIKNTENMVSPKVVGNLFQRAEMLRKLPVRLQKYIINKGASKSPYISFIVEPYSLFLAYEITNIEAANRHLPQEYELIPCSIFDDRPLRFCAIIGAFNVHTSVFWGNRIELYIIAKNKNTGMMSWIICDYESNTISYDPGQGFLGPSTKRSIITTSYAGELIVDVMDENAANKIALVANIKAGKPCSLLQRLWVEGNLSVDYGGDLEDEDSEPFGLIFDPKEMEIALNIPLDFVNIEHNTFGYDMLGKAPFEVCCFPFAQHFLTTSVPIHSPIKNEKDLESAIKNFNDDISNNVER